MKKYLLMMMAAVTMVAFVACGDDNKEDDEPVVTTDSRILSVIPNKYLSELKKHMTIYDGMNPPNVTGTYLMGPSTVLVFDSHYGWDHDPDFGTYYLDFTQQNEKNNTLSYREADADGVLRGSGHGAYICGEGNNFTVYLSTDNTQKSDGKTITYTKATIISGTLTSEGIRNLRYAFLITNKSGDPDDQVVMMVGAYRVIKDKDEFTEKVAAFDTRAYVREFEPSFIMVP